MGQCGELLCSASSGAVVSSFQTAINPSHFGYKIHTNYFYSELKYVNVEFKLSFTVQNEKEQKNRIAKVLCTN